MKIVTNPLNNKKRKHLLSQLAKVGKSTQSEMSWTIQY
jgi:hypothetical protein